MSGSVSFLMFELLVLLPLSSDFDKVFSGLDADAGGGGGTGALIFGIKSSI